MTAVASDSFAAATAVSSPPFLELTNIGKSFGRQSVLSQIDLAVPAGELAAILGPSGCGKSTLLRIIAGLETADRGMVQIAGRDVTGVPPAGRRCGIVFQSYALFPNLTVAANIGFGIGRRTGRPARKRRVAELLELIGLPDIAGKHPAQLSGGQQQRVALARALATTPSLLLLDEPLSALDATVRLRLRGEIRRIQQRLRLTTILVTHDQDEALTMADRVVVMDHGRILQVGSPEQIYSDPRHRFVGQFVGSMNFLPGWTCDGGRQLHRDGVVLNHTRAQRPAGTLVDVGFRSESARIVPTGSVANSLIASVKSIEFRGAVRRIYLSCGGPADPQSVTVDTPADQPVDLPADRRVGLHLPPSSLHLFGKNDGTAL